MRLSQFSLMGTGTAEESDRYMPRPITPYRGAVNESRWGRSVASHFDKVPAGILKFI